MYRSTFFQTYTCNGYFFGPIFLSFFLSLRFIM